jgi:hypothetical protein
MVQMRCEPRGTPTSFGKGRMSNVVSPTPKENAVRHLQLFVGSAIEVCDLF